jgi:hypothetical protein
MRENERILAAMEDVIELLNVRYLDLRSKERNAALACALAACRAAVRVPAPTEDEICAVVIQAMAHELQVSLALDILGGFAAPGAQC